MACFPSLLLKDVGMNHFLELVAVEMLSALNASSFLFSFMSIGVG